MGLDVYLKWKSITPDEEKAQLTGFQVAGPAGYLRSSYNDAGFNSWASRYLGGHDLYWVFDKHDEVHESVPDWQASLTRAKELLASALNVAGEPVLIYCRLHLSVFTSDAELLAAFKVKASEKHDPGWGSFSCREGDFFLDEPVKVIAVMQKKGYIGNGVVLVCPNDGDAHNWYIDYIRDHIIPFIELGMSKPGAVMHWSG